MKFDHHWHLRIFQIPRPVKRLIMVSTDIAALSLALWSAFALRFSTFWPEPYLANAAFLFLATPLIGVIIFARLGLYRAVVRFMNIHLLSSVAMGIFLLVAILLALASLFPTLSMPRSVPLIFGLSIWLYIGGSRLLVRSYYHWWTQGNSRDNRALIYGAGGAGAQLAVALQASGQIKPVGFIDDDRKLKGSILSGLQVYPSGNLEDLISANNVSVILLAMARISASERKTILENLAQLPVKVKTMPSLPEIIEGKAVDELREIDITDLLGRDMVDPDEALLSESITAKSVCITGAGGSIGSELARQALVNDASHIVLYETSEIALYTIDRELQEMALRLNKAVQIIPIIGSVLDKARLVAVLKRFDVVTVFHAAAYKHVPLVEHNVLEGLKNNTLGTLHAARAAQQAGVMRFILISTDKAVRPTNVMGATKRFAELCIQYLAETSQNGPIFSMVRFGNVLGSSGSVVPLFREQIAKGGPVTVTHPEINRYFMTISEAASLVIQAGAMARGGEVFVLDMGEPVKITQLAESMVHLSGVRVKNHKNPDGDIEILYTGLRPGEKLYEELLLGDNVIATSHPKILCAQETSLDEDQLTVLLASAEKAIWDNNAQAGRLTLKEAVAEFAPSSQCVDWLGKDDKAAGQEIH